jgi:hypothetical protein
MLRADVCGFVGQLFVKGSVLHSEMLPGKSYFSIVDRHGVKLQSLMGILIFISKKFLLSIFAIWASAGVQNARIGGISFVVVTSYALFVLVEVLMTNQGYQVVFTNQTDNSSSSVGNWECTMLGLASFQDVAQGVDGSQGHNFSSHELVGSDEAVAMWDLRDQDWHLFSSYSFLIQTSIA